MSNLLHCLSECARDKKKDTFLPLATYKKPAQDLKALYFSSAKSCAVARPDMPVLPRYFEQGSHWVEVRQGRVSISQLDGGDAERPDVTAGIVGGVQLLLASYDLQAEGGVVKEYWSAAKKINETKSFYN